MNIKIVPIELKIDLRKKDSIQRQIIDSMKYIISKYSFDQVLELPSIKSISETYQIDHVIIKEAFDILVKDGLLIETNNKYYINRIHLTHKYYEGVVSLYEAIKRSGYDVTIKFIEKRVLTKAQQQKLGLTSFKQVLFVRKVYYASEIPVILLDAYYDASLFEDTDTFDYENLAIFTYLEDRNHFKINNSKRYVSVKVPPKDIQKYLSNPTDSATIVVTAKTFSDQQLVEYGVGYASINYSIYLKTIIHSNN